MEKYSLTFILKHNTFRLIPINDNDYMNIRKHSIPILYEVPNSVFFFEYALPKWYIGLKGLFGKSSEFYDDYKGAFAFSAKVELTDSSGTIYDYLCHFINYRSYCEINIYKILPENKLDEIEDKQVYRSPFSEFPQDLYQIFYNYMFGFCEGYSSTAPKDNFIMKVQSNHIIFGFLNNKFIEFTIDDPDEFESTWQQMIILK